MCADRDNVAFLELLRLASIRKLSFYVNCGALFSGQRSHTRTRVFLAGCQCLYRSDWLILKRFGEDDGEH
jgi:hypothetical protein